MKFTPTFALSSLLALGTIAVAQTVQSKPFYLEVYQQGSKNSTTLQACHIGAGAESLCVGFGNSTFGLNTTQGGAPESPSGDGAPGTLTYALRTTEGAIQEGMGFYIDPSTNVAMPAFGFGVVTLVAFDKDNLMNVVTNYNDLVTPPTAAKAASYYRWYICETNFEGYRYNNLAWVYGKAPPQNPSCKKATIKRVFA